MHAGLNEVISSSGSLLMESLEARLVFSAPLFDITDLGAGVEPLDLNDAGQFVALRPNDQGFWPRAVLWTPGVGMTEPLAGLTTARRIVPAAIAGDGTIVGSMAGGEDLVEPKRPFLFRDGELIELPTPAGWPDARAAGVTDNGAVLLVGGGRYGDGRYAVVRDGSITREGRADTMGISSSGVIAGNLDPRGKKDGLVYGQAISPGGLAVGVPADDDKELWISRDGGGTDRFLLRVDERRKDFKGASVFGVNDRGQVVGSTLYSMFFPDSGLIESHFIVPRAFLLRGERLHDLTPLVGADSGWRLTEATAVNARGQIVGVGYLDGVEHGFLLTPRQGVPFDPAPGKYDVNLSRIANEDDEDVPEEPDPDEPAPEEPEPADPEAEAPKPDEADEEEPAAGDGATGAMPEEEQPATVASEERPALLDELEDEFDVLDRGSAPLW